MRYILRIVVAGTAASALLVAPTMAVAQSPRPMPQVSPLAAVGLLGTQASAQAVCSQGASSAAAAGAALAVQAPPGCVLPAADAPPPIPQGPTPPPPPPAGNFGVNWLLLSLGLLALFGGISTLFDDDDSISPA